MIIVYVSQVKHNLQWYLNNMSLNDAAFEYYRTASLQNRTRECIRARICLSLIVSFIRLEGWL